jgi:hypothetical protein
VKPKMRRNLPGTFRARDLGGRSWRLSRSDPQRTEVFVLAADSQASDCFRAPDLSDIDIVWRADAVSLTMTSNGRSKTVKTQSAIVHEPLPHLYAALPLAGFDEKARRFWRRVFRLVRIPGGRHLLGVLARSSRGRD